jgi:hypothetical protein
MATSASVELVKADNDRQRDIKVAIYPSPFSG